MSEQDGTPEVTETAPVVEEKSSTITSLDDALKVINKLNNENASRRIKAKEIEDKAKKWEEYVESQKTELEKLTESNATLAKENEALKVGSLRERIAQEEKVPADLMEFLSGDDEQTLRAAAKKLASVKPPGTQTTAVDFYAGQRGIPVAAPNKEGLNEFFTRLWKENNENGKTRF